MGIARSRSCRPPGLSLLCTAPHPLSSRLPLPGGISSGQGDLFCSQPVPPLAEESGGARRRPRGVARAKFVGLAICKEEGGDAGSSGVGTGGGSDAPVAGGLAVQGMEGAQPVLSRLVMVRNVGFLEGAGGGPGGSAYQPSACGGGWVGVVVVGGGAHSHGLRCPATPPAGSPRAAGCAACRPTPAARPLLICLPRRRADAELMAVADAQLEGVEGPIGIGMLKDLAYSQTELGLWAGPVQEGAAGAGRPAGAAQLRGSGLAAEHCRQGMPVTSHGVSHSMPVMAHAELGGCPPHMLVLRGCAGAVQTTQSSRAQLPHATASLPTLRLLPAKQAPPASTQPL